MINSNLVYLIPVWGTSATQTELNLVKNAQNQAIRNSFCYYNVEQLSTFDIIQKYQIMNITQLIEYSANLIMYKM